MFSLNENNRIVMARYPCDMQMGVNSMCGRVRAVGFDPASGDVYVFVSKSRKVMKILYWERGGNVIISVWSRDAFILAFSCAVASGSGQCGGMSWCC